MYWYNDHDFGGAHLGLGLLSMFLSIAFFALVIYLLVRLFERGRHTGLRHMGHGPSPLEILDMRLARGEISKDDYIVARELLEKKN